MRRSFRSTTALAAVIAMLAPASVLAETSLPPQKAAAMDKASREDMPQRAAKLDAELADGLSAGMLTCVGDAPRPCPDDQPLVTPGGLAVRLAQDDAIVLAPRKTQREASQPEQKGEGAAGKAAAEAGGEAAAAAKAAASGEASGKKNRNAGERGTGEEAKAGKKKEKVERKAAGDADPGDPAMAAGLAAAQKAAKVNEDAAAAASDNGSSEAKAAQAEPANASGPVVSEPIPPAKPQVEPSVAEANPVVEDRPTPKAKQGKEGKKKRDMASEAEAAVEKPVVSQEEPDADALARALGKASGKDTPPGGKPDAAVDKPVVAGSSDGTGDEADAAALAAALAAATGKDESAAADANAVAAKSAGAVQQAEAPKPVTVDEETSRSLEETLKAAAAAAETKGAAKVKKAQQAQQVASKPDPASDNAGAAADAAASAAAAGTAPVADALNAPAELSNDATAVVVTEGSARSSAEDFATRITDGLTREQQAQFEQLRKQVAAQRDSGKPVVVNDTASASDDDDDKERDLARLLLAGVGGYALANILANNGQIALSTPDRVVVQQPDGSQSIIKDDNALLLRPGTQVTNENFADGSSRSIVTRDDGSRVVTIRDANLQVLRRTLIASDGTVTELIDDAQQARPVVVSELPPAAPPVDLSASASEDALRAALAQEVAVNRSFTLGQIRNIPEVRALVAPIDINAITFDTGSAAISPDQAQQLATLGRVISESVRSNPAEVFLIEGYTDTVGSAAMNLALSDRRAESVALALSQYFDVPPENLVVQGYGERFLKVNAEGDIRENRRASVRRITDLLATN